MNKRVYYLNLLSLLNEAGEELNISDLKERDRTLLAHIWKLTSEGTNNYSADYSKFSERYEKASKNGFFNSLKILRKHNLIRKISNTGNGIYELNTG